MIKAYINYDVSHRIDDDFEIWNSEWLAPIKGMKNFYVRSYGLRFYSSREVLENIVKTGLGWIYFHNPETDKILVGRFDKYVTVRDFKPSSLYHKDVNHKLRQEVLNGVMKDDKTYIDEYLKVLSTKSSWTKKN